MRYPFVYIKLLFWQGHFSLYFFISSNNLLDIGLQLGPAASYLQWNNIQINDNMFVLHDDKTTNYLMSLHVSDFFVKNTIYHTILKQLTVF